MKSKEELNALKEEVKALNEKLRELTDEELAQVVGGEVRILPKDHYENIILGTSEHDEMFLQTHPKDINSNKNAKVIYK